MSFSYQLGPPPKIWPLEAVRMDLLTATIDLAWETSVL